MIIHHKKFCVYTHSIDGNVFYVGLGSSGRAFSGGGRNQLWDRMVSDAGGTFSVEILAWFDSKRDAMSREKTEIQTRKPVTNMTLNGYERSSETRLKISSKNKGKRRTQEFKEKIRQSQRKNMVAVLDITTGISYESLHEASRALAIPVGCINSNARSNHTRTTGGRQFEFLKPQTAPAQLN